MDVLNSAVSLHALSSQELECIFALGFALDQLRGNLTALVRCVRERARRPEGA